MEQVTVSPKLYFYLEGTTNLKQLMEYAAPKVDLAYDESARLGLEKAGPIEFVYFGATSDVEKEFALQIGFPVNARVPISSSEFQFRVSKDFRCLKNTYKGSLIEIGQEYEKMFEFLWNNSIKTTNEVREIYHFFEFPASPNNITEIQIGLV